MFDEVRVGVGCYIFDPSTGKFIAQLRDGSFSANNWSPPGGHMEFGESPEETAVRETMEEIGIAIDVSQLVRLGYTNDLLTADNRHYITLAFGCLLPEGAVPQIMEPHKAKALEWIDGTEDRPFLRSVRNFIDENGLPWDVYRRMAAAKDEAAKAA